MIKNTLILLLLLLAGVVNAAPVTLGWDANTEPDLAGYRVYYGGSTRFYTNISDAGTNLTFTLNLNPGTYYLAATAYNTNGAESDFSMELLHTVQSPSPTNSPAPGPPINVVVSGTNTNSLTLSWSAPTTTNRIIGYRIFSRPSTNVAYGPYQLSIGLQHTLSNLVAGTRYHVAVAALDSSALQSQLSPEISATTISAAPPPIPPQGFRIITILQGSKAPTGPWENLAQYTNVIPEGTLSFFRAEITGGFQ